jgi:hypothetical protein
VNSDAADEVVRSAERAVYQAQWRIWEELALGRLTRRAGLGRAQLIPGSDVIQLVAYNGEHLGHVRQDHTSGPAGQWVAVRKDQAQQIGAYTSAAEAAAALVRACHSQTGKADQ